MTATSDSPLNYDDPSRPETRSHRGWNSFLLIAFLASLLIGRELTLPGRLSGELPPPPPLPVWEQEPSDEPTPPKPIGAIFEALNVPEGFEVTLYADDDLAHDIYSMTIDAEGRVVVAGAGYVRILEDTNGDGVADEYRQFADGPKNGAMGMYFLGPDLLCTGDAGLLRYRDEDRDGRADGEPDVFLKMKTGGEHDSHAIRRGPDGWWYIIAGNNANITSAYATLPTSPVKQPSAGTLMRLKPDMTGGEIYANGMRNAYDFDFNHMGDLFTYDSDGERDISLPWYRPTRVFHLLPGSHAGWISRSWKRPGSFLDMPPVLGAFGRGSPTGVVMYRHTTFPEEYQNTLFVMDWTFGRVMALPMRPEDGVWSSKPEEFMTAKGQFGFAPTDMAVGHDGSLYLTVGGRGTRGAVFRVTWKGNTSTEWWDRGTQYLTDLTSSQIPADDTVEGQKYRAAQLKWCLNAPQPLCSWSRARWMPIAQQLGAANFRRAALDRRLNSAERVRAIEIMTELFGGLPLETVEILLNDPNVKVRARTVWSLGRHLKTAEQLIEIVAFIDDGDPLVVRSALEAILTAPPNLDLELALPGIARQLDAEQHFVRQSAARVISRMSSDHLTRMREITESSGAQTAISRELGIVWHRDRPSRGGIEIGLAILEGDFPLSQKQQAVRLLQLSLGDVGPFKDRAPVFDGYAPQYDLSSIERSLDPYRVRAAKLYPSGDADLDHELLRVLALLQPYNIELLDRILAGITEESHPTDDIHRLITAARIPVERSYPQTEKIAQALVQIDHKIADRGLNQDSNWDDRMKELFEGLLKHDPILADVIIDQEGFGLPPHVLYLGKITDPESLPQAVEGFVKQIAEQDSYVWTNDVVFVLGESEQPEHRKLLRQQYDNYSVRSAVLSVIAADPQPEDRAWFLEGLEAPLVEGVMASAKALQKIGPGDDPAALFSLLYAAQRLNRSSREFETREIIMKILTGKLGDDFGFVFGKEGHQPQVEAMSKVAAALNARYPKVAREQLGQLADQLERVTTLASQIDSPGDPERGRLIFEKRACARCHGGRKALGPDLAGVAKRFSRRDLITSIVNPDQNVSNRYQTTMIVTDEGKSYAGIIVYQSVDGLILRDAESKTWRFEAPEIELKRQLPNSLMPAGLLKDITAEELADLLAYLESL
ncbi:MAG: HEAT repeat domain-containing protein [Planctomycetaceae bacterium]|nr:HEAT repeat domain-containing protein [Planctomycetaceae bacterium]